MILSINTNNFAHVFAVCKSEDQSSYTSLNKRTQREAPSHLSASLPEATPVPGQLFCTNFNILKAALNYTSWWGSKGAAFVAIADGDQKSINHGSKLTLAPRQNTAFPSSLLEGIPPTILEKYQVSEWWKVFLMAIFLWFSTLACL